MTQDIRVKRIYEAPAEADGLRILADRLWPRGVSKAAAQIDDWPKQFTPSTALRKWYYEDTSRYEEFVSRYLLELEELHDELSNFLQELDGSVFTLLTATKDPRRSHVAVLKRLLEELSGAK